MGLVELINSEAGSKRHRIILTGLIAGVANTIIIACVNAAAKTPSAPLLGLFVQLILSIVVFAFCARYSSRQIATVFENVLYRLKLRMTNKLRKMELQGLERIGTAEIYDRVTENMTVISESASGVTHLLRSAFMVVFGSLYMIYISIPAFVISSLLFALSIAIFVRNRQAIKGHLQDAAQQRLVFLDFLTDLLQGFQEVKFSRQRSDEMQEATAHIADKVRASTLTANLLLEDNLLIPTFTVFVLLGAIAFVLPMNIQVQAKTISTLVALTMFIFSPISGIVGNAPVFLRANLALENIGKLEQSIDENTNLRQSAEEDPWEGKFQSLVVDCVEFIYGGKGSDKAFQVGPVSFTISPGEVIFIVGGNGSGKSTLLKVLMGVYPPSAGTLEVGGTPVKPENVQAYREMISPIFSDFHLFKKLYGLAGIEDEAVRRLIALMQLDLKTSYAQQSFTTVNLSTGQRKRLAMIVALLEDRPIYAFDEWAADQDPEFRKYFYTELIPELKRRGKTVLVVTHDDRYFHCADRVITMEYGKLGAMTAMPAASAGSLAVPAGGSSAP